MNVHDHSCQKAPIISRNSRLFNCTLSAGITDESHRNTLLSAALPRRCSPNHSSTLVSSEQRSKDGNGQSGHGFSKHFEADGCDESPKLREMGNHKTGADIAGASSERDMDEMDQINLNDTDEVRCCLLYLGSVL